MHPTVCCGVLGIVENRWFCWFFKMSRRNFLSLCLGRGWVSSGAMLIFFERRGTVQLGFWLFQRIRRASVSTASVVRAWKRKILRSSQVPSFLTSRRSATTSLLSHPAIKRDYSLCSTDRNIPMLRASSMHRFVLARRCIQRDCGCRLGVVDCRWFFKMSRRNIDCSLCSISKHPKKNAEELACLGLC